jgi:hypothetical protein
LRDQALHAGSTPASTAMEEVKEDQSFDEFMQQRIADGYVANDGTPLKCDDCGGTKFHSINEDRIDYGICEYDYQCLGCKKIVGHWAYGNWCI